MIRPQKKPDQEAKPRASQQPSLAWSSGTAYDFFASLAVLHDPEHFGLRASWAAGVRSRLAPADRKFFEDVHPYVWIPFRWILTLPAPRDARTVLFALRQIPAAERIRTVYNPSRLPESIREIFESVAEHRVWSQADLEAVLKEFKHEKKHRRSTVIAILDGWAQPEQFGEQLFDALQTYYQNFFAEEEALIAPVLEEKQAQARAMAERLSAEDLIGELSQGVRFDQSLQVDEIIFIPSYWITPLIVFDRLPDNRQALMYGARPANMSLVPGDPVPDALLHALKAFADPTRLRLMRYLIEETLTPAQLARKLRLRAPTVTHHLSILRLAGLVNVMLQEGGERRYAVRRGALASVFANLESFLEPESDSKG